MYCSLYRLDNKFHHLYVFTMRAVCIYQNCHLFYGLVFKDTRRQFRFPLFFSSCSKVGSLEISREALGRGKIVIYIMTLFREEQLDFTFFLCLKSPQFSNPDVALRESKLVRQHPMQHLDFLGIFVFVNTLPFLC